MPETKSIIGEICALISSADGLPYEVLTSEIPDTCGETALWIEGKGGAYSTEYADGGEIQKVPFELKLRYRDIDPSDRFSAMEIFLNIASFLRKTGCFEDVSLPEMPTGPCRSTAVYSAPMKFVKEVESDGTVSDGELRIILRSGERELIFSRYSSMRILADGLCGFDFPGVDVKFTSDVAGNISYPEKRMLSHRDMSILFEVTDDSMYREVREKVIGMMDPMSTVTVTGYYMGRHRTVTGYPSRSPEFYPKERQIKLYLSAPQPYFSEGNKVKATAPRVNAMLNLPMTIMKEKGVLCSLSGDRVKVKVDNPGDTSCPVTVYLHAFGDVSRPYVILNGKKIKYLGDLHEGDMMRIRTGDGEREIMVNNIITFDFDRSSRFFALAPGENEFMIYADSGHRNLVANFEFEPRYLGI